MNASNRPNTCKWNVCFILNKVYAWVANGWVTRKNLPSSSGKKCCITKLCSDCNPEYFVSIQLQFVLIINKRHRSVARWACVRLGSWWDKSSTKPKIFSWFMRMIGHTGTETRPRHYLVAAVRNLGQWTQVWSSHIARGKKALLVVNL